MEDIGMGSGTINSVGKVLQIIEEIQQNEGCTVDELSESLAIPKSTAYKYLKTLELRNYIRNTDGVYYPGYKFLQLGGHVRDQCRIFRFGRPKVEKLAAELDELVFLSILDGEKGVFIFRVNDQYNLKASLPLGKRFYLHQNGSGKAMLAELPDARIKAILENQGMPRSTELTITSQSAFMEEIREIRSQGYALNRGERDPTSVAVSSAIVDGVNDEIGAVGISFPKDSPAQDKMEDEYATELQRVSSKLTHQLRHS